MDTVPQPKIPVPTTSTPSAGCGSFRPTGKLPLYERQYAGEAAHRRSFDWGRMALEEAKSTVEAMDVVA